MILLEKHINFKAYTPKYGLFVRTVHNELNLSLYSNNKAELIAEAKKLASAFRDENDCFDNEVAYIEVVSSDNDWVNDPIFEIELNEVDPRY